MIRDLKDSEKKLVDILDEMKEDERPTIVEIQVKVDITKLLCYLMILYTILILFMFLYLDKKRYLTENLVFIVV